MSRTVSYDIGEEFFIRGEKCDVVAHLDIDKVLVRLRSSGKTQPAMIRDLKKKKSKDNNSTRHHDAINEKDWQIANARYEVIKPILEAIANRPKIIKEQAKKAGISERTVRRWHSEYLNHGLQSSLAPRSSSKRKRRLSSKQEKIIQQAIKSHYLVSQKGSGAAVIREVNALCSKAGIKSPSSKTIRTRIRSISGKEATKKRHGRKATRDKFDRIKGIFPDADFPLATVQIDHTILDAELVDDEHRLPIGRPWLTIAIDVFSRMVTGMYLSLDPPSAFSVGMCIQSSVLPKDDLLDSFGIEGSWPVWGKMSKLHFDNGKDFKSETVLKACEEHQIDVDYRPVKQPHFGGHIERLIGTINTKAHELPGTTFSNIFQRGEYKPRKRAVLTLDEARRILLRFIVGDYHQRIHSALHMSPLSKWKEGIQGSETSVGRGLIDRIADPERFEIDFLPSAKRTIQRSGISWDRMHYSSEVINRWIGEKQANKPVEVTVRRDPHDMSQIYFLDPEVGEYFAVPMRDTSRPTLSLWEWKAVIKRLRDKGESEIDEELIFQTYEAIERDVEHAKKETVKARRQRQRKRDNTRRLAKSENTRPRLVVDNAKDSVPDESEEEEIELSEEDLKPKWREID